MAAICFNCGKGVMYGHNVSHAKNRTRKLFKPNLHSVRIIVGGTAKRVKLCTKCVRKFKSATAKVKSVEVAPIVAPSAAV
ncbi:MAG: 50S ribosomal protein L28 [Candidatus Levyibacteriota bacterium]|jgi:large subunit ribosomal protein L28